MRPYLLAAAFACGGVAVVPAVPAAAAGCVATAATPSTSGALVHGSGTFTCAAPAAGMSVTVCVQSLQVGDLAWQTEGCASKTAATVTSSVTQDVAVCFTDGPALVRSTAIGSNAAGETGGAVSAVTWAPGAGSCGP